MSKAFFTQRRRTGLPQLVAAGIFIATAVFDLAAHPASQGALRTYKEYLLTATIFPAVAAVMWALLNLHELQGGRDRRVGRTGLRIATGGLLALAVDAIVTIASASTDTSGPLYPAAMLVTLIGVTLLAIDWYRAGILPHWIGPALALGWLLGATPILGDGGFLIVGAAFLAVAFALRRDATAPVAPPAGIETSITA